MTEVVIRDDAPVSQPVRQPETVVRDEGDPRVVRDQFGRPRVKGIRTDILASRHAAGESLEEIAADYPGEWGNLTVDDVRAAVQCEAELQARREAKKAKRKDPVRRQLKANGRATKQRGYRCEKKIEGILSPFGFERMIMSGALGGEHSGDLRIRRTCRCNHEKAGETHVREYAYGVMVTGCTVVGCQCRAWELRREPAVSVIEVKRRQDGQKFLRDALKQGGAHAVVVDPAGGDEPLFVVTLTTATHLLREAGYQLGPHDDFELLNREVKS